MSEPLRPEEWERAYDEFKSRPAFPADTPALKVAFFAGMERARSGRSFQARMHDWCVICFGEEIADDRIERNHRFLEDALELVQALGCTRSEAHQLVDYTFDRAVGDARQEVGGVMTTLAALCAANGFDMQDAAEIELVRIWTRIEKIRAKQAAKPKIGPLPAPAPVLAPARRRTDLVPGVMTCAKCKFRLQRMVMDANSGAVGAQDSSEPEHCPNGCGPLWPVTWEQEARELGKRLEHFFDRAIAAERVLAELVAVQDLKEKCLRMSQSTPRNAILSEELADNVEDHNLRASAAWAAARAIGAANKGPQS